jgi:hypothetical protein
MVTCKRQLSGPRKWFLELAQEMNFGQIRNLSIKQGEPQYQPAPVIAKDWKLDGDNQSRPELNLRDFALKEQHLKLFEVFDAVGDGVIDEIHVRYGLPCRVITSQLAA